jgi:hypothetical protein
MATKRVIIIFTFECQPRRKFRVTIVHRSPAAADTPNIRILKAMETSTLLQYLYSYIIL